MRGAGLCETREQVPGTEDNFDFSAGTDRLEEGFHFYVDSGWLDAPDGWTLGEQDQILCPAHRRVELTKGDADAKDE